MQCNFRFESGKLSYTQVNMQVERTNSNDLLVDKLPDGSRVMIHPESDTVFALNPAAGAAWDACR